jgi:hypothetical protein
VGGKETTGRFRRGGSKKERERRKGEIEVRYI